MLTKSPPQETDQDSGENILTDVTLYIAQPVSNIIVAMRIYEAPTAEGDWVQIERATDIGGYPSYITEYTTSFATNVDDWFAIAWEDSAGNIAEMSDFQQGQTDTSSILANPGDVNAHLQTVATRATQGNTALIQISVARVIRAYLARIVDPSILVTWATPDETPDIIREIASMLIASQLYINEVGASSTELPANHIGQILYNNAIAMLNQVIAGTIPLPNITDTPIEGLSTLDFFPVDSTDRAFTMGMNF